MKKYKSLIIWIAALALVFTAAYVVYDKYKSQIVLQPPVPNALTGQDRGGTDTSQDISDRQDEGTDDTSANDSTSPENADNTDESANGDNAGSADDDRIMVPDFTLRDLDGNDVTLSDYRGKIVVLNFWAVWCRYCIEEMPDFNELDRELAEAGDAVVLAVNVQEPYDTVNDYITKNDIGIKVLLDEDGYVSWNIFGVSGYPTTFVVNKDGSLYTYLPGKTDLKTMRTIIDMVRENAPLH